MRGAISLGKILGINVYIHLTFFLIFLWVGYERYAAGADWMEIMFFIAVTSVVFVSVLMHEYGHALAARRYGIATHRIVLLPIGGVAQIERMPEKPEQELFVTIMGPMVNLAIAILMVPFLLPELSLAYLDFSSFPSFYNSLGFSIGVLVEGFNFLGYIFVYNILLLVFNLLPAFPMDGGRILRALLNIRIGLKNSTLIAARIGQVLAIGIVIFGFYGSLMWILLGIFVFAGAEMELRMVTGRPVLKGLKVGYAMLQHFTTLIPADTLKRAAQQLLAGSEKDFLVEENGEITGIITRDILIAALSEGSSDQLVATVMKTEFPRLEIEQPIEEALQLMKIHNTHILPVYRGEQWIGAVSMENITEVILLQGALEQGAASDVKENPVGQA